MIKTLRQIVQEVSAAPTLSTALETVVQRISDAVGADVCSVYIVDPNCLHYTLMASKGLNPSAVGQVSIPFSQGLVGLVGQREEPLNINNASSHPDFHYIWQAGEDHLHTFLGAPIIHQRNMEGILVIQRQENFRFNEHEEAFIVTIAAQLAGVIAHAKTTGSLSKTLTEQPKTMRFEGKSGAPGVAIGHALIVVPPADLDAVPERLCQNIHAEQQHFDKAVSAVRQEIQQTAHKLTHKLPPQELALFDVYLQMLSENALGSEIKQHISEGFEAQTALRQVIEAHLKKFNLMDNSYFQERAIDLKDLGCRILSYLQKEETTGLSSYPDHTILIAEELTANMLGKIPTDQLAGLISIKGSSNSHTAILARAMNIPTVMGADSLPFQKLSGIQLIIDGNQGIVYTSPSEELICRYQQSDRDNKNFLAELETIRREPCLTRDNHRITLLMNTGLLSDNHHPLDYGAEGVGLFRTEATFMTREQFPSESEQEAIYRQQLQAFSPYIVTMRTLDIGGDKPLDYFSVPEDNPFLGWRGIRVTLDHPEIFMIQVRAMLKASNGLNNLQISLPMISNILELDEALALINRALYEVRQEGMDIKKPAIGLMIEIPAAAWQIRELASRVDFISVGSNDLTQYLLAVDRNNARVADLYDSYHPAVLRTFRQIIKGTHRQGKKVSICGEIAGDPIATALLIAMEFDALSMSAASLLKVKWVLQNITFKRAQEILHDVMQLESGHIIRQTLLSILRNEGLIPFPGEISGY